RTGSSKRHTSSNYVPKPYRRNDTVRVLEIYEIDEKIIRNRLIKGSVTTVELLQEFKSKIGHHHTEKMVDAIALVVRRLNVHRKTIDDRLHLCIYMREKSAPWTDH
ncbi:transcription factor IIF-alpha (TFIIF-alpha)-like, partial [Tropilaelaps mercedesae]